MDTIIVVMEVTRLNSVVRTSRVINHKLLFSARQEFVYDTTIIYTRGALLLLRDRETRFVSQNLANWLKYMKNPT